jgi:hypothetical protein
MRYRIGFALAVATIAGVYQFALERAQPESAPDPAPLIFAARSLIAGQNPYDVVGRAGSSSDVPPVLYPLPAILLFTPVASLPIPLVSSVWIAIGAGLLAWAVTRERLLSPASVLFVSTPFIHAVQTAQWTPLLTSATLLPAAGFLFACKPTTALWLFAYNPRWQTAVAAAMFLAVSIVIWPGWIFAWRANFSTAVNVMSPLTLPGGVLIALVMLLRWRRREARLLGVMACVPHSTLPYELIPLFLIPETWPEAAILFAGAFIATALWNAAAPYESSTALTAAFGVRAIWCVYLPCAVMILRRPNETPSLA